MDQIETREIVISNQLPTKATFAITTDDKTQAYVPASVAHACDIEVGQTCHAVLVPNVHESADKTPWMAVKILESSGAAKPTRRKDDDFSDIMDALRDVEFPVTADEAGVMRNRLERAWRQGEVIKVEARQSPSEEPKVMWAVDWDVV